MKKIQLKGYECNYLYEHFGNEETIVFSNSLGADLTMWEEQVDILSHHYNVLRYDTVGHGNSSPSPEPFTLEDLGGHVIALLDHLKLNKVIFCGLSMGGLIGQWLGIHHTRRFSQIILANTSAKIGTANGWNQRIEHVSTYGLTDILEATAERWFTEGFREERKKDVDRVLQVFEKTDLQSYINCCEVVRDADFREELVKLEVPVLIISGLKDMVTTPEDGRFLQKKIPLASHLITYAAHLSSVEQGVEFSKFILFFTQH